MSFYLVDWWQWGLDLNILPAAINLLIILLLPFFNKKPKAAMIGWRIARRTFHLTNNFSFRCTFSERAAEMRSQHVLTPSFGLREACYWSWHKQPALLCHLSLCSSTKPVPEKRYSWPSSKLQSLIYDVFMQTPFKTVIRLAPPMLACVSQSKKKVLKEWSVHLTLFTTGNNNAMFVYFCC